MSSFIIVIVMYYYVDAIIIVSVVGTDVVAEIAVKEGC